MGQAFDFTDAAERGGMRRVGDLLAVFPLGELYQHAVAGDHEQTVADHGDVLEVPGHLTVGGFLAQVHLIGSRHEREALDHIARARLHLEHHAVLIPVSKEPSIGGGRESRHLP